MHWLGTGHDCTCPGGMQVCFRLTYYQGRAGLVGVDAVVGHSSASLGPPDKALKKSKAKPSKRKAANQKASTAQQAGARDLFLGCSVLLFSVSSITSRQFLFGCTCQDSSSLFISAFLPLSFFTSFFLLCCTVTWGVPSGKQSRLRQPPPPPLPSPPGATTLSFTCPTGEPGTEGDLSAVEAIVQHYQAVQQSNAAVLQPSNAGSRDKRIDAGDKYYSNGTPAERYWGSMGSENNSKRQNVSSLLQTIFPDGLAPLAQKVAKVERKEQAKAAKQAARQAAAAAAVSRVEADPAAADSSADFVSDPVTGNGISMSRSEAIAIAPASSRTPDASPSNVADLQTASIRRGTQPRALLFKAVCEAQARSGGLADCGSAGGSAFADRRTVSDAASAIFRTSSKPHEKHYSHGQKLAATMLWEAASGKSQPVILRQCLTYSEIRIKNLAGAEVPLSRLDVHEPAFRVAQEV